MSLSHELRNLQKSHKYLNETLGAYDFKGYMKVGSNTFSKFDSSVNWYEAWEFSFC